VLLHGLCGSVDDWRSVMELLSGDFRVIAPQFPIRRRPGWEPRVVQSIAEFTELTRELLDSLGVRRAVFCGHSLGGQIAIDFSLRYPERVAQIVLCGSAGLGERTMLEGRLPQLTRDFVHARVREIFYEEHHANHALVEEMHDLLLDRRTLKQLVRAAMASRAYDVRERLGRLNVSALLIWGKDDTITPPSLARVFQRGLRTARLEMLDQCGHAPPIERPEQVAALLHAFVREQSGRPTGAAAAAGAAWPVANGHCLEP
jgi:2-hydroxy-6-oxonona-2,4-dienedioate hydrolase